MEGGVAKLLLRVFDSEENFSKDHEEGHAEFRLKKDEAVELINGLKNLYNLQD